MSVATVDGGGKKVSEPVVASQRRAAVRGPALRRQGGLRAAILLLPSALLVLLFRYYPAVRSIVGSFTEWNGFSAPTFIGLRNYATFLDSASFLPQLRNLAILFGGGMILHLVAPFLAA